MRTLGRYKLITQLSNKDAGSCRWCIASLNGQEYFVKEFLEPKYPANDTTSSLAKIERKIKKCRSFEEKKKKLYRTINYCSDGNAVRVNDFFRVGAKYYMAMPKINAVKIDAEDIAGFNEDKKRKLCAIIAHSVAMLHNGCFVHSDIKHSNVLFTHTKKGALTVKLIDYDAGFFEDEPPTHPEEIGGDQVYFSPEVWLALCGESVTLARKIDVFALGILFYQYMTGKLPEYDTEKYSCVGEAVAMGDTVSLSLALPIDILRLLGKMLSKKPEDRPTAWEAYNVLIKPFKSGPEPKPEPIPEPKPEVKFAQPKNDAFVGDAPGRIGWQDMGDLR